MAIISYADVTLTLREHYAGLALQGILACGRYESAEDAAKAAVLIADALIAALNATEAA